MPDLTHSYFAEICRGIEDVARPVGYRNLICNTDENAAKEMDETGALLARTDGLIVASSLSPDEAGFYRRVIKSGAKIVFVDRLLRDLRGPVVTTDDVRVGVLATEHLISLGHRRIDHLRGTPTSTGLGRFEGYRQALAKHKISYDPALAPDCGLTEGEGYAAMRDWLTAGWSGGKAIEATLRPRVSIEHKLRPPRGQRVAAVHEDERKLSPPPAASGVIRLRVVAGRRYRIHFDPRSGWSKNVKPLKKCLDRNC